MAVTLAGATAVSVTVSGVAEDTVKNIENVTGGSGADRLAGDGLGNVLLGNAGNDVLTGNGGIDTLKGGTGDDVLKGGGAADALDGGAGFDTAVYSDKTAAVVATAAGATALHVMVGGFNEDTIISIENLTGGSAGDTLTGNSFANMLIGNDGDDVLRGGAGNDILNGGAGLDKLTGGAGLDTLIGGGDNDQFIYTALSDSGITSITRERITGFASGDKINVRAIDAQAGGTDDAFVLGGAFSEGHIRQSVHGTNLLIEFNADAVAGPDMSILLVNHPDLLGSGDFLL